MIEAQYNIVAYMLWPNIMCIKYSEPDTIYGGMG